MINTKEIMDKLNEMNIPCELTDQIIDTNNKTWKDIWEDRFDIKPSSECIKIKESDNDMCEDLIFIPGEELNFPNVGKICYTRGGEVFRQINQYFSKDNTDQMVASIKNELRSEKQILEFLKRCMSLFNGVSIKYGKPKDKYDDTWYYDVCIINKYLHAYARIIANDSIDEAKYQVRFLTKNNEFSEAYFIDAENVEKLRNLFADYVIENEEILMPLKDEESPLTRNLTR